MKQVYIYLYEDCNEYKYFATYIEQEAHLIDKLDIEDNILTVSFACIGYETIIIKDKDIFLQESLIKCIDEAKTYIFFNSEEYKKTKPNKFLYGNIEDIEITGPTDNIYNIYSGHYCNKSILTSYHYIEDLPIIDKYISKYSLFKYLNEDYNIEKIYVNIYEIPITNQTDPNRHCTFFLIKEMYIPLWNISINFADDINIMFNAEERYKRVSYNCNKEIKLLESKYLPLEESKRIYDTVLYKLKYDKITEEYTSFLNDNKDLGDILSLSRSLLLDLEK